MWCIVYIDRAQTEHKLKPDNDDRRIYFTRLGWGCPTQCLCFNLRQPPGHRSHPHRSLPSGTVSYPFVAEEEPVRVPAVPVDLARVALPGEQLVRVVRVKRHSIKLVPERRAHAGSAQRPRVLGHRAQGGGGQVGSRFRVRPRVSDGG